MNNFVMVCYDISDSRRLRRVANIMENYGARVQKSVFECHLKEAELNKLKQAMQTLLNPEQDSVRYYYLCPKDKANILVDGRAQLTTDPDYQIF